MKKILLITRKNHKSGSQTRRIKQLRKIYKGYLYIILKKYRKKPYAKKYFLKKIRKDYYRQKRLIKNTKLIHEFNKTGKQAKEIYIDEFKKEEINNVD